MDSTRITEIVTANILTLGIFVTFFSFVKVKVEREYFMNGRTVSKYSF